MTGKGFLPETRYDIPVIRPDGSVVKGDGSFLPGWDTVETDEQGDLIFFSRLNGIVGTYEVRVYDEVWEGDLHQEPVASVTFTDANPSANLDQLANKTDPGTWQNGNLNASNSLYREGMSVPYRAVMTDLPVGATVTLRINYDTVDSGKHAIDYLTTYDVNCGTTVNPLAGVTGVSPLVTTYPIPVPTDPNPAYNAVLYNSFSSVGSTNMTLFGGTLTGVAYSQQDPLGGSSAKTYVDVTFTVASSTAVLAWGGHIASRYDWGSGNSASALSGSPYHMRLLSWTINGVYYQIGNQDRSLSAGAVPAPPPRVEIVKTPDPEELPEEGGWVTYTITVNNLVIDPFTIISLTDDRFGNLSGLLPTPIGMVIPGYGSYTWTLSKLLPPGMAGTTHVNTVTVTVREEEDKQTATDYDDATVTYRHIPFTITVEKTANPTSVPECGGYVDFAFKVTNNSSKTISLISLNDDTYGEILSGPITIGPYASVTVPLEDRWIEGDYPGSHKNTVTATAEDAYGHQDTDVDDATVTITDCLPDVTVEKTASPTQVPETGGYVDFTFVITNQGSEDFQLTSLTDTVFGDLDGVVVDGEGNPVHLPVTIAAGKSLTVYLNDRWIEGDASGEDHENVVTAVAEDNDGSTDSDDDGEKVSFADVVPDISLTKIASPDAVPETGGEVTYTFLITNNGEEAVTFDSLVDDQFGDLSDKLVDENGNPVALPVTIEAGESFVCYYKTTISGDYPGSHTNVAAAIGSDNEGNTTEAVDEETVDFLEVVVGGEVVTPPVGRPALPYTGFNQLLVFVAAALLVLMGMVLLGIGWRRRLHE
ncbi:hypothetical protein [Candidatus Solincola tengchongensis]|uniref:DUF7507 domain-containing protein n=1 Tax=Candidatus Solincola tengchongensis TaxID=2900693 RepID=UPI00257E31C1|nr:hypothetical protein [Candidatus Solincola tengchongensis]